MPFVVILSVMPVIREASPGMPEHRPRHRVHRVGVGLEAKLDRVVRDAGNQRQSGNEPDGAPSRSEGASGPFRLGPLTDGDHKPVSRCNLGASFLPAKLNVVTIGARW
jgi:hypothetical protein